MNGKLMSLQTQILNAERSETDYKPTGWSAKDINRPTGLSMREKDLKQACDKCHVCQESLYRLMFFYASGLSGYLTASNLCPQPLVTKQFDFIRIIFIGLHIAHAQAQSTFLVPAWIVCKLR